MTNPGAVALAAAAPVDPLRPIARRQHVRQLCAAGLGIMGVFDLITAVRPPSHHLSVLLHFAPLVVAQGAGALLALCGLVLLALTWGVRRGQRQAWLCACGALVAAAVLHLARGIDGVQSALSLVLLVVLLARRRSFFGAVDHPTRRSAVLLLAGSLGATVACSTASLELFFTVDHDGRRLPPVHLVVLGVGERLIGVQDVAFPPRVNRFLSPTLAGVGIALAIVAVLVISRPLVDRRRRATGASTGEARRLVSRHGGGTLDYFALRHDKRHYFSGDTLITYAVHGGICLVSPDPIGPSDQRVPAWAEFCRFAEGRGWIVAVLGANSTWLPIYRRCGQRSLYIGDEAVVQLNDFSLAGGHKKGLRQAVNRVARYGYQMSFHDPCQLDPQLADSVRTLMEMSRRGNEERGFSMTLGRLFDPDDANLLLAVAHDANGRPVAFCQFVPAPAIDGYSLDLMRREPGQHPNGLVDFVLVSTIEHLRGQGMTALGLNFATMRALLAGEGGNTWWSRAARRGFQKLSSSMQIESLGRFSAKYDPEWVGRYLVFGSFEHLPAVGLAVARAESFWELPVIGRYLDPGRKPVIAQLADTRPRAA